MRRSLIIRVPMQEARNLCFQRGRFQTRAAGQDRRDLDDSAKRLALERASLLFE